jgi:hypothetical protein
MYRAPIVGLLFCVEHDRWPRWARPQLLAAVDLAATTVPGRTLAAELYDRWFAGAVAAGPSPSAPLVGAFRRAHAEVATSLADGVAVLDRHDRLGTDGWWRTWNTAWRPRQGDTRVLLSPRAADVADVVGVLTARLRDVPYLLAAPSAPDRLARSGSVVLHLARPSALSPQVIRELTGLLRTDTPPLCLPVAPGIALAQYPENGMTFGEHRCHLLALALRTAPARAALPAIAEVFAAHGVDPSTPYRSRTG